jgi:hypothetical protein
MSTDLTFITNEQGNTLGDRLAVLGKDSRYFDCMKPGRLEICAYPSDRPHAIVHFLNILEGVMDKGRDISVLRNLTEAGLQATLEFNQEVHSKIITP